MSDVIKLESFDTRMGREWRVLVNRTVVYEGDATGAKNVKETLEEYARTIAAEVERLQAEVERLTRDRYRLTSYVLAALPLCRDALTRLVEERPEEAARVLYKIVHALACAVEEGDDQ